MAMDSKTACFISRDLVRGLKIDAAHWDSTITDIIGALVEDFLAKPRAEREAFVRSLANAPA